MKELYWTWIWKACWPSLLGSGQLWLTNIFTFFSSFSFLIYICLIKYILLNVFNLSFIMFGIDDILHTGWEVHGSTLCWIRKWKKVLKCRVCHLICCILRTYPYLTFILGLSKQRSSTLYDILLAVLWISSWVSNMVESMTTLG